MAKHRDIVTVQVLVDASIDTVWKCWTTPADIIKWNNASDDWHTPEASNDLRKGGKFSYRMEAKDASMGFDFGGVYSDIIDKQEINYTLEDGRKTKITFIEVDNKVQVIESFEAEDINSIEMQRQGWQAILDNFQKYVEHQLPKR
ncbi:polyketide cyclase [Dysgonomonas sp. HDW5A]|uniref:SRPBCC family protein n=1 Tax=Dysgonomonas sp. HDW5A TaxID=2714926 RepID=UPI001407BDFA|nr:SRPBCC family protein [Dysgonomonas sp. HDW5A]QIK60131.1 polyketide cyclase [Dysgonomonas sp. HDW5A]